MSEAREKFRNFKPFESPPTIYRQQRKRNKQPAAQKQWADWIESECERFGEMNEQNFMNQFDDTELE